MSEPRSEYPLVRKPYRPGEKCDVCSTPGTYVIHSGDCPMTVVAATGLVLIWQKCPRCDGQGHTSRPPWVPGDQPTWPSSTAASHPCPPCNGSGLLAVPAADIGSIQPPPSP